MTYVLREQGRIVVAFGLLQPGYAEESLAEDDPELLAFLNPPVVPDKRAKAIEAVLSKIATQPDAPQEVKDYVDTKGSLVTKT